MRNVRTALLAGLVFTAALAAAPTGPYAPPGRTVRASVDANGRDAPGSSSSVAISSDGRTVAFITTAALVPQDTNGLRDVYVKELDTGAIERVSVSTTGAQVTTDTLTPKSGPAISGDGRIVAFESGSAELVPEDTNGEDDVFVRFRDTNETIRVSVSATGAEAAANSTLPALTADGRYVFFISEDDTLVPGDTSPYQDIFRRDLQTGAIEIVTLDSDGRQSVFDPTEFAVDADGDVVAWASRGPTYTPPDVNGAYTDVFVRDLTTRTTTRVSDGHDGAQGTNHSTAPSISADGRLVAFASNAENLVPFDRNGVVDAFVHDRATGRTVRVSVDSSGRESPGGSGQPAISGNGRFVAFNGISTALDPDGSDTNPGTDVYLHDLHTGATNVVSLGPDGATGDGISFTPDVSFDGRRVAFTSRARDLVPDDTNDSDDVFVRDVGPALGVGAVATSLDGAVEGWARFRGTPVIVPDASNDATFQVANGGGEIVGGSVIWRPERDDVRIAAELQRVPMVPPTTVGVPTVKFTVSFKHAKLTYQVRYDPVEWLPPAAQPAPGRLVRCAPACTEIGTVPVTLGGVGRSFVVVLPGDTFAGFAGTRIDDVSVLTTWSQPGLSTSGDSVSLGSVDLGEPRVEVATGGATPPADGAYAPALLERGRFTAPAGGSGTTWARACIGTTCGPAVNDIERYSDTALPSATS